MTKKQIVDDSVLDRISEIARLKLTPQERESFKSDCNEILGYFSQIRELSSKHGAKEKLYMRPGDAMLRKDEPKQAPESDAIRGQFAQTTKDGLMKAPKNL